ncbi:MAG: HAD hydrolase family protein [Eggerthia catenaformis]|uniref:HAD hydrolase family protein n=1 Tax=Eggerthia catenaformis TaxID=31973 RepID=UPI003F9F43F0
MNDKTLLKNVKYSYAMKNADKNIKKIALRETDDNNHDGVLKIISLLLDNQFNY